MIEMNIAQFYGVNTWKAASLTVDSGVTGDNDGGSISYDKIARAVGELKDVMLPPSVNKSTMKFIPSDDGENILYSLKAISGVGNDVINHIIENRPYTSYGDFLTKMKLDNKSITLFEEKEKEFNKMRKEEFKNSTFEKLTDFKEDSYSIDLINLQKEKDSMKQKLSKKTLYTLIKSGLFDEFNKDRKRIMVDTVAMMNKKKKTLSITTVKRIHKELDQDKFKEQLNVHYVKDYLFGKNYFNIDLQFVKDNFLSNYSHLIKYEIKNNDLIIDKKDFEKIYDDIIQPLKAFLKTDEAINLVHKMDCREDWLDNCIGSVENWEMQTLMFYSNKHEIEDSGIEKYYNIVEFKDLNNIPNATSIKKYNGREFPQYQKFTIAGTVIEKNPKKALVSILTKDSGVVTLKLNKKDFIRYDEKVTEKIDGKNVNIEKSWFERGTIIVSVGHRNGEEFVVNCKNSNYDTPIMRLERIDYKNKLIKINSTKMN